MAMDTLRGTFESGEHADRPDFDDRFDDRFDLASDARDEDEAGPEATDHDDPDHDNSARDVPPAAIGQDERRMQVRAYNHWAALLGDGDYPSIEDLEPGNLPDFGPHSVLLDFSAGIEDPAVQFLGTKLARECDLTGVIERLSDVPARSLLSRITDHYMQILANEAPIGFEAEFVNQRGASILYRGILLPFSSDGESIDFIYGVINWKEMADAAAADELLLEIDQALEAGEDGLGAPALRREADALADWADSPAHEGGEEDAPGYADAPPETHQDNIADFAAGARATDATGEVSDARMPGLPVPDFGQYTLDDPYAEEDEDYDEESDESASYGFASLTDYIDAPAKKAIDLDAERFDPADYRIEDAPQPEPQPASEPEPQPASEPEPHPAPVSRPAAAPIPTAYEPPADLPAALPENTLPETALPETALPETVLPDPAPARAFDEPREAAPEPASDDLAEDADLYDCLAAARELARSARASEDRSRQALYAAVGRAYDFSLAAREAPSEYTALIAESGLNVQDRAPMTPVVKLVFGSDYDKTRLTEYAAALSHAHRLELPRGTLADFLGRVDGGLKGVVTAERRLRREEAGKAAPPEQAIREALAQKLRELEALTLDAIAAEGPEFALVMLRRGGPDGVAVIGEIGEDIALIERAARRLVG